MNPTVPLKKNKETAKLNLKKKMHRAKLECCTGQELVVRTNKFLIDNGLKTDFILDIVKNPIVSIDDRGVNKEVFLYDYLMGHSYEEALAEISKIVDIRRF